MNDLLTFLHGSGIALGPSRRDGCRDKHKTTNRYQAAAAAADGTKADIWARYQATSSSPAHKSHRR